MRCHVPKFKGRDSARPANNHTHSARLIASISCRKRPKLRRCGVRTSRGKLRISGSFLSCANALPCTIEQRHKTSANLSFNSATPAVECAGDTRITSYYTTIYVELLT